MDLRDDILYVDLATEFDNDALIARFAQELNLTLRVISPDEQVDTQRLRTDDEYAASVLVSRITDVYSGHGELVTETTAEVVQSLDATAIPPALDEIQPVQRSLSHPRFYRDTLGNPVFEIRVDGEVVEDLIRDSSETIINLSLEVGTLNATLETRREVDPYIQYDLGDDVYYSLKELDISQEDGRIAAVSQSVEEEITPSSDEEKVSLLLELSHLTQADVDFLIERSAISPDDVFALSDGSYQNLHFGGTGVARVERLAENTFSVKSIETMSLEEAISQGLLISEGEYLEVSDEATTIEDLATPVFHLSEAYNPQRAREALTELFAIAEAHPDKLFFAAAGNQDSYFYEALQQLAAEGQAQPSNIALVGVYFGQANTHTDGATFYFHRDEELYSASEATAAMSGIAAFLEARGFNQQEIMPFIEQELMEDMTLLSPSGQELTVKVSVAHIFEHLRHLNVLPKENPQDDTSYYFAAP